MSTNESIEHHRAIEYRISDHKFQSLGFTVTPSPDARRFDVCGQCPACGGFTETTWDYGTGNGYKAISRRGAKLRRPVSGPRTVCCDCGHNHANRPDGVIFIGCGAYWQVELP